jgi:hypothetical protein
MPAKQFSMLPDRAVISPAYSRVIRSSLASQLVVGCVAALVLDGGIMARVVGVAVLAFWLCVATVIWRRPLEPTMTDLALVRWGFWVVLAVAAMGQMLA